jgi:serine/threonine protein kinase
LVVKILVGRRVELGQLLGECGGKWGRLRTPFKLVRGPKQGKLTCRSLLGQGGFATVVVCVDEFGVSYAVKMPTQVYTELTSVRGGAPTQVNVDLKPFLREVEALRSVSGHPCIVGFHGFIDSPPALVFELCKCSLRDVLRHGGLGPVKAAEVLVQIADALAFLHSKGYVHGDVKPENILFSFEGVPKLSDFNTAKALATISKTKPGYTPGYAAPEQLWKEEKVTEKADSWALGLVLYEAVTGKPLLPLDDLGYREAVARLEREKLAFESTGIREIDELVESCLKVNPVDRPSAKQIRDTLAKFLVTRI